MKKSKTIPMFVDVSRSTLKRLLPSCKKAAILTIVPMTFLKKLTEKISLNSNFSLINKNEHLISKSGAQGA